MRLSLYLPIWMLWTFGAVVGIIILGLAAFGVLFIVQMRDFSRSMNRWFGW